MERQADLLIDFRAIIRTDGGFALPFTLKISVPEDDGKGAYFCLIDCPYIRSVPFWIFGIDEMQAFELSFRFVSNWLRRENVTLVDKFGEMVQLPKSSLFPDFAND